MFVSGTVHLKETRHTHTQKRVYKHIHNYIFMFIAKQLNEDKLTSTMIGVSKFPNKDHIQFCSFEILHGLF